MNKPTRKDESRILRGRGRDGTTFPAALPNAAIVQRTLAQIPRHHQTRAIPVASRPRDRSRGFQPTDTEHPFSRRRVATGDPETP